MPNRSHKVVPLGEKVKVLEIIKKKLYAKIAKLYSKNESFNHKIVKKGKIN